MDIGLIGLPGSGKTTVFNALTGQSASTAPSGKLEANQAIVKVPDERVDRLAELYEPKKVTHATVKYVDLVGLQVQEGSGLPTAALTLLGQTEMLVVILRGFDGGLGAPDPASEAEALELEMTISDLQKVENRLPKMEKQIMRVAGAEKDRLRAEQSALEKAQGPLEAGQPLRELEFTSEELLAIRGFQFLTLKPTLYLVNTESVEAAADPAALAPLSERAGRPHTMVDALAGKIEEEIAQLDAEEREIFMGEYGIERPGSERIIRRSYELLGLMSFLTGGKDEVRAWTIRRGSPAPEAAGAIHSDIQQGFIRAEVVKYEDLMNRGSMKACRDHGELRTEGKAYVVQDGDVIEFLFNK
ncbi:YchF family ATPase [bacterium]|nr:YchF family ATPase [bacterium]